MAVGRRPNTVDPSTFFSVSSGQLLQMTDEDLIAFADELGIVIPLGTPRGQILTKVVNSAVAGRDAT